MSETQIVKPEVVEIVPRPNLSGVEQAIERLNVETAKLAPYRKTAEALVITNMEECQQAKFDQVAIRGIKNAAATNLDPFWDVVKRAYDALSRIYKTHESQADAVDKIYKDKVRAYEVEEKRRADELTRQENERREREAKAKAEQERRDREREAKEKRDARVKEIKAMEKKGEIGKREAAKLMREAGALEEAAIEQAAADADAKIQAVKDNPVEVKPNTIAVAGVPSTVHYKAEVKDPVALLFSYVATFAKPPDLVRRAYLQQFITIDVQRLGLEARTVKDSKKLAAQIPGVRFYEE